MRNTKRYELNSTYESRNAIRIEKNIDGMFRIFKQTLWKDIMLWYQSSACYFLR